MVWPILDEVAEVTRRMGEMLGLVATPTLRLGVTGLARSGKTVFITALVQALMRGEKLPVFRAAAEGRLRRARLEAQPDDDVARFAIEEHLAALSKERRWPDSTRRIAQLRLALEYEPARGGPVRHLLVDIVDYPGEWLLDLALLDQDYRGFAYQAIAAAESPARREPARRFLAELDAVRADAPADEAAAERLADAFKAYLALCRNPPYGLSTLPPGRFLLPGDMEGSPALTFAPVRLDASAPAVPGSLAAMMARRYEAYRTHVVEPFFRKHFQKLDRQIVLVDVLAALQSGPDAVTDLESALAQVLLSFRAGRNSLWSSIFSPRIDRVVFAATKADHLHHTGHDRLEAVLRQLLARALQRAEGQGAAVTALALASVRATSEAKVHADVGALDTIVGTPEAGESLGGRRFSGDSEVAIYPGELPTAPAEALQRRFDLGVPRLRPPLLATGPDGRLQPIPHIRLDRALEALLGDRLV
jgi:hypothetical protein